MEHLISKMNKRGREKKFNERNQNKGEFRWAKQAFNFNNIRVKLSGHPIHG